MKLQCMLVLLAILTFSCKKVVTVGGGGGAAGGGGGAGSGDGGGEQEVEDVNPEDLGEAGEIDPDVPPSESEESFNLTKFIATRKEPDYDEIKQKIDPEQTKIAVGERERYALETNSHIKIDPAESAPAGERKLEARFWIEAYMVKQKVKNVGPGAPETEFFMEAQGTATLDKLGMEAFYRYLGVDVTSKTITAGWEPRYTRDNEVKFGANVVIVGAEVSLRMGGEIAVKFEFGMRRDGVLNLIFTPQAHVTSGVGGTIKLAGGIAGAGPVGTTTMMKYTGRGNANIGYIRNTKMIYADIGVDPGSMVFTDGKVDIVAKSLGRELYRKNVFDPKPLNVQKLPQYGTTIVKYVSKPADCGAAAAEAERVFNANIAKLIKYREAVADEDKPVITTGINRMNELKVKAKKC